MSRKSSRNNQIRISCECLDQAYHEARKGEKRGSITGCPSKSCSIREVDPGVVDSFLRLIGALTDEPGTPSARKENGVRRANPAAALG